MYTIKDIARRAGVSDATVSRVINKKTNVKPETRERVEQVINELNYYPSDLARSMRSKKTNTIGLLVADINNPFYSEMAKTIIEKAGRRNYSVILCNTNNSPIEQQKYIDILMQKKVDGIIYASVNWVDSTHKKILAGGIPLIFYNRKPSDFRKLNYVALDNEQGAIKAMEYLYDFGHRQIAFIRGPGSYSTARERLSGYKKALKKLGLKYDSKLVRQGSYSGKKSFDAIKSLLKQEKPPTAVFATNDLLALIVMDVAAAEGLRIPEDLSVIGFNDIYLASHRAINLTTVSQSRNMMAEIAIDSLYNMMESEQSAVPVQVALQPQLIVRKSTGPVPASGDDK